MTDARIVDLAGAVRALPMGSGVIFRHYHLAARERKALFRQIRRIAHARRMIILLADRPAIARAWGADGAHHRSARPNRGSGRNLRSVAVHSIRERRMAQRARADLILVSPVYPTPSHPGAPAIGVSGLLRIAGPLRARTIALGGMTAARFTKLRRSGIHGWAGISALAETGQKRNAVPT